MPNFLNKTNKAGKTKRAGAKALASGESGSVNNSINNNNNNNNISNNNSSSSAIDTTNPIKLEVAEVLVSAQTVPVVQSATDTVDDQKDNVIPEVSDKCTMPFVVTKSGSDMSTITVNNTVLPLNTSDDLERAAALLMHQTLDDELEFVNIKSELIDPIDAANGDDPQAGFDRTHHNALPSDFPNFHGSDFFYYSCYPQAAQCDFAMMPLPPINTVKRKLKGINSSSTVFPGMANVL